MSSAYIDDTALNNHLEKLKCLSKIQRENLQKLDSYLQRGTDYYNTNNKNKILDFNQVQKENLKILSSDTDRYIDVIEYNIAKYLVTKTIVENKFGDIE